MKSQVECESFLLRIALMSLHSEQYKATPQLNIHLGTMMRNWSSMGRETPIVTFISWNVKRFESHPLCFSFLFFFFARSLFACAELAVTVSRLTQCDVISYLPEQLSFFAVLLILALIPFRQAAVFIHTFVPSLVIELEMMQIPRGTFLYWSLLFSWSVPAKSFIRAHVPGLSFLGSGPSVIIYAVMPLFYLARVQRTFICEPTDRQMQRNK